jgi:hypothetical protein
MDVPKQMTVKQRPSHDNAQAKQKLPATTAPCFVGRLPDPVCHVALRRGKRGVVTPGGIR